MERTRSTVAAKTVATTLINIEDVLPGMVLAEPVRDANGRLLVTRGAAFTRRLQRQLRLWGIAVVTVETHDDPDTDLASYAQDAASAQDLIATYQSEPFMRELARLAQIRHGEQAIPSSTDDGSRS